jgi:hypothetical protein
MDTNDVDGKLLISMMTKGGVFTQYMVKPDIVGADGASICKKKLFLFFKDKVIKPTGTVESALYYLEAGMGISKTTTRSIRMSRITEICLGKHTPGFNSPEGSRAINNQCFSIISRDCSLDLEAPNLETMRDWILGIRFVLSPSKIILDKLTPDQSQVPTPSRPVRLHRGQGPELDHLSAYIVANSSIDSSRAVSQGSLAAAGGVIKPELAGKLIHTLRALRKEHTELKVTTSSNLSLLQQEMLTKLCEERAQAESLARALQRERKERQKLLNRVIEIEGNIRVFCRVRPPQPDEDTGILSFPEENTLRIEGESGPQVFKFDQVYAPHVPQHKVPTKFPLFTRNVLQPYKGVRGCAALRLRLR